MHFRERLFYAVLILLEAISKMALEMKRLDDDRSQGHFLQT